MPKNIFSNGMEYEHWQAENCSRCKKYENESLDVKDAGCKAAYYIDLASVSGNWPKIIQKITGEGWECKSRILSEVNEK